MNRADRRKATQPGEYEARLKAAFERGRVAGIDLATPRVIAAVIIALNTHYGFSTVRLQRMLETVNESFDAVSAGTVDLQQLVDEAERCGVTIRRRWD